MASRLRVFLAATSRRGAAFSAQTQSHLRCRLGSGVAPSSSQFEHSATRCQIRRLHLTPRETDHLVRAYGHCLLESTLLTSFPLALAQRRAAGAVQARTRVAAECTRGSSPHCHADDGDGPKRQLGNCVIVGREPREARRKRVKSYGRGNATARTQPGPAGSLGNGQGGAGRGNLSGRHQVADGARSHQSRGWEPRARAGGELLARARRQCLS